LLRKEFVGIETTMEKSLLKRNIYRYTTFLGLSLCHSQDAQNVEFIIIPLFACKCILGPTIPKGLVGSPKGLIIQVESSGSLGLVLF